MTKHIDKKILNDFLSSPQAPVLLKEMTQLLEAEKKKRQHFYNEVTEQEKAEFINGEIIIHSPVMKKHNEVSKNLLKLLDSYVEKNDLGYVGIEKILIQLTRNDYEPDICFFKKSKAKKFKDDQSIFPAPDFVVEVLSKSTEKRDRGIKFEDYEAHQIKEYWIIDPKIKSVEQYILKNKKYILVKKSDEGILKSEVVPNFEIPIEAVFDKKLNLKTLTKILS